MLSLASHAYPLNYAMNIIYYIPCMELRLRIIWLSLSMIVSYVRPYIFSEHTGVYGGFNSLDNSLSHSNSLNHGCYFTSSGFSPPNL